MTDVMRKEVGAPKVVDRTTFDAQLDALRFERRLTRTKATPSQPLADGYRW